MGAVASMKELTKGMRGSLKRRKRSLLHFKAEVSVLPWVLTWATWSTICSFHVNRVIRSATFTTDRENLLLASLLASLLEKVERQPRNEGAHRFAPAIIDQAIVFRGQWDSISGDQ